tara:strand:+ start:41 stop:304 length:264 start_codon:yes stop_codon:yes gene_type:complete
MRYAILRHDCVEPAPVVRLIKDNYESRSIPNRRKRHRNDDAFITVKGNLLTVTVEHPNGDTEDVTVDRFKTFLVAGQTPSQFRKETV